MAIVAFGASQARAAAFSLTFGGETLSGDTVSGITTWTVAGVAGGADQLFLEAYYLQLGAGAVNVISPEFFRNLGPNSILVGYNTDGVGTCSAADLSGCEVTITHVISGTTGWSSSFGFQNLSNFNIFTYSDFDLSGTAGGDTANYIGAGDFRQVDEFTFLNWQINSISSHDVQLCCGFATPLQNRNSATGDVTFETGNTNPAAFSIDRFVAPVPEPASMLLFGSGLFGLAGAARRRFSKKAK